MNESNGKTERRNHHHLRDIFDQAYAASFPLLDSKRDASAAGSMHFLRIVLHEEFPSLHQQDIAILSVSIERVFRERGKSTGQ